MDVKASWWIRRVKIRRGYKRRQVTRARQRCLFYLPQTRQNTRKHFGHTNEIYLKGSSSEQKSITGVDLLELADEAAVHVFDAMAFIDDQTLPRMMTNNLKGTEMGLSKSPVCG